MNELLELLDLTKNNGIEVSVPLTGIVEDCLVEVNNRDDISIDGVLKVSGLFTSFYALATRTTYLNTAKAEQLLEFEIAFEKTESLSKGNGLEKEFRLFCKKAFDLISWYIETIPYQILLGS